MEVTKINHKNGGFEISMDHLKNIMLLSEPGYDIMKDCGNFIELHMRHNQTGEEFVFTMQKKKSTTPSEYRKYLEDEIERLNLIIKERG